jgi:hypothetical protein
MSLGGRPGRGVFGPVGPIWKSGGLIRVRRRVVGGKKLWLMLLVVLGAGGGIYYWLHKPATTTGTTATSTPSPAQTTPGGGATAPKPHATHPMPGETVAKEQPFFESDYGFSMVVPAGWKVVQWTDPVPPEQGKRRPSYKIRLEDPRSHAILDFACYPFTEKSRTAVEEIFISKIEAPIPGYELDIQVDEVVKEGDMRIRRAELRTQNPAGATGIMKTYYYLSNDKLYTFSVLGNEGVFASQDSPLARLLSDIKILG